MDFETKGYSQYGASMGRNRAGADKLQESTGDKLHLRRVRLDSGGYDKGGAYWGFDLPLWCAWDDEGRVAYVRASSRDEAKRKFPNAKFYR